MKNTLFNINIMFILLALSVFTVSSVKIDKIISCYQKGTVIYVGGSYLSDWARVVIKYEGGERKEIFVPRDRMVFKKGQEFRYGDHYRIEHQIFHGADKLYLPRLNELTRPMELHRASFVVMVIDLFALFLLFLFQRAEINRVKKEIKELKS